MLMPPFPYNCLALSGGLGFQLSLQNINFIFSCGRKKNQHLAAQVSIFLEKNISPDYLFGYSSVAVPAGHPLGYIIALADSKLFAQSLVN